MSKWRVHLAITFSRCGSSGGSREATSAAKDTSLSWHCRCPFYLYTANTTARVIVGAPDCYVCFHGVTLNVRRESWRDPANLEQPLGPRVHHIPASPALAVRSETTQQILRIPTRASLVRFTLSGADVVSRR
jgi:hypothetical protein